LTYAEAGTTSNPMRGLTEKMRKRHGIAKPGSIKTLTHFTGQVYVLSKEEAQTTPVFLADTDRRFMSAPLK
jgi:translation elongation factor EF-Tu-like GTPase